MRPFMLSAIDQIFQNTELRNVPTSIATNDPLPFGILLVEDDDVVREAAAEILESSGYYVVKVRSSSQAVEQFKQNKDRIGLLITDAVFILFKLLDRLA